MGTLIQRSRRKRCFARVLLLFVLFSLPSILAQKGPKPLPNGTAAEYDIKAAFLLNFARFVEWPQPSERAGSPFAICILGDDPFGDSINHIIAGESISGRPFAVKHLRRWPDSCELLFISASYPSQASVLAQVGTDVLTVGEAPDFLRDGGMIRFFIDDRRVRFDINRLAVDRSALKMSSRLLGVARRVLE